MVRNLFRYPFLTWILIRKYRKFNLINNAIAWHKNVMLQKKNGMPTPLSSGVCHLGNGLANECYPRGSTSLRVEQRRMWCTVSKQIMSVAPRR